MVATDAAIETLEQVWVREHADRDAAIAEAIRRHAEGEEHRRPRGLFNPHGQWSSGEEGTPMTAMPNHPGMGWFDVAWPSVINRWSAQGGPTGTATWVVKVAPPGTAITSPTTVLTCALTVPESGDDTFDPITIEPGSRWAAFLTAVGGGLEWTSFNLEPRRT